MKRDMTLYKYCDIYMLLTNATKEYIDNLFVRAKELDMDKVCAFAVIQMSKLFYFNNDYALMISKSILEAYQDFIHTVIAPRIKKKYVYFEKDISKRFFNNQRINLLKEVGGL